MSYIKDGKSEKNNTAKKFFYKESGVIFLKVRDIMTNPAISVTGEDTVCEAARVMQAHNIGALPVVSEKNTVDGIVTDRDIVLRTVSRGKRRVRDEG
ncbi:MAG: CBS domain-containing protein [Clostridiales bacterium]|nr:MAG: CBS domain-containing protein [Clostridiales bacterium]